jgi:NADH-quinone oxidoreductase subunit L
MTVPLMILAVLSVVGGWVGLPHGVLWGDAFGHYLAPSVGVVHGEGHHLSAATVYTLMAIATGVGLVGIYAAYAIYLGSPATAESLAERLRGAYRLLWNKYYVDELYDAVILTPFSVLSRFCWKVIDDVLVDGIVNGVGGAVAFVGSSLRLLQTGNVQSYALATLIGAIGLLLVYVNV